MALRTDFKNTGGCRRFRSISTTPLFLNHYETYMIPLSPSNQHSFYNEGDFLLCGSGLFAPSVLGHCLATGGNAICKQTYAVSSLDRQCKI